MKQTDYPAWYADSGLELIRLDATRLATVEANRCSPETLEELAEACVEAAAALRERSEAAQASALTTFKEGDGQ